MFDLIPFEHKNNLWNPFADFERSFFGDLEKDFPCKTPILDQDDHYLIKADMPRYNKEDIHIGLNGDCLTISAEHKIENEEKKDNFLRRERRYGSLSRSFNVSGVDVDRIEAGYQNGVLELKLPKLTETTPASRQIEIK